MLWLEGYLPNCLAYILLTFCKHCYDKLMRTIHMLEDEWRERLDKQILFLEEYWYYYPAHFHDYLRNKK